MQTQYLVNYAEAVRTAHGVSKLLERLALIAPLVNECGPSVCPLRIRHYALSGALTGFSPKGWECPWCGEFFVPTCAGDAGGEK